MRRSRPEWGRDNKSLITTLDYAIQMHDLLEELGKKIARENSTAELRKWSRLWLYEDLHNVLLENMVKYPFIK